MTDGPDPLRSKGFGLVLAVLAAVVALISCGAGALAIALVLNFVTITVRAAGGH